MNYLHLPVKEFYYLTPREFDLALKIRIDDLNHTNRFQRDMMRIQTMYLFNVHLKANDRKWNPKYFMPFPDEYEQLKSEEAELVKSIDWGAIDKKFSNK